MYKFYTVIKCLGPFSILINRRIILMAVNLVFVLGD